MFYHLIIFGDSGIVNGTYNLIDIDRRILFIKNMSFSFDFFGILILLFNLANYSYMMG